MLVRLQIRLLPLLLILWSGCSVAQSNPVELVRETVQNEIHQNNGRLRFKYLDTKNSGDGTQTKLDIETKDLTLGMLVALNGQPLSPQQRAQEESRLEKLASNPADLAKKKKSEQDDDEHTERIMRALPDAFIYTPDGTVEGREGLGTPGAELMRLNFRPNPNYVPPTHVEQVLTGMKGQILIDEKKHRIARIDGTLIKDVEFGWGVLGRLDKGGRFLVEQGDVGSGAWEVTKMDLNFHGKALFFKTITIVSSETFTSFGSVPSNLTVAQAVELLKKQETELAENHPALNPR